jgi:hypothetical protein
LTNDIGDIKLSNIIIEGDSSIINSTGSLNINLNDISNTENINLRTDIGSIDLKLPKSFNFNTEKVDSQITSNILNIINDKTSIKVEAGLGSVKLNGQKVK